MATIFCLQRLSGQLRVNRRALRFCFMAFTHSTILCAIYLTIGVAYLRTSLSDKPAQNAVLSVFPNKNVSKCFLFFGGKCEVNRIKNQKR